MFKFVVVFNSVGKVWDPFSHARRRKVVAITCQTCCILVCGSLSAVSHLILSDSWKLQFKRHSCIQLSHVLPTDS